MSDRTAPTELQIKINDLIRQGYILWMDRNETPFAYTRFGEPCPPTGKAAFIAVAPEDYDRLQDAIISGEVTI